MRPDGSSTFSRFDGGAHVERREVVGGAASRDPSTGASHSASRRADRPRDAGHGLQPLLQRVGIGAELELRAAVAREREPEDGLRIRIGLVEDRRSRRPAAGGARRAPAGRARRSPRLRDSCPSENSADDLARALAAVASVSVWMPATVLIASSMRLRDLRLHDLGGGAGIARA